MARLLNENEALKLAGQRGSSLFTPSPVKRESSLKHGGLESFIQNQNLLPQNRGSNNFSQSDAWVGVRRETEVSRARQSDRRGTMALGSALLEVAPADRSNQDVEGTASDLASVAEQQRAGTDQVLHLQKDF